MGTFSPSELVLEYPTPNIFLTSDSLKMIRVHAMPDSAEMIKLHTFWNQAIKEFMCNTVSLFILKIAVPVFKP